MNPEAAYALLAADAYRDARKSENNYAPVPPGWTELKDYAISGSGDSAQLPGSGFSARVYRGPGNEIVISYAGTQFGGSGAGQAGDWLAGNAPLAFGLYAQQAVTAAELYQRVRAELGSNITFTGHSLGGGLAAMMAVYFDRPAKVFAPAPFGASVDSTQYLRAPIGPLPGVLNPVRLQLWANSLANPLLGPVPPALLDYTPLTDYNSRAANVQAWAVKGEVLEKTLLLFKFIESSNTRKALFDNSATQLDMLSKHSIDLHAAGLLSATFNEWAAKLPDALPIMFNRKFYAVDLIAGQSQDFLVKLVRNEVGIADLAPNGMLTHFASDLQKLGANIAGLNQAAQDALTAQGIEWYYWQGADYAGQEFFILGAAAVAVGVTISAPVLAGLALGGAIIGGIFGSDAAINAWEKYRGSGDNDELNMLEKLLAEVALPQYGLVFGTKNNDTLDGTAKADYLFGGGGDDTLNGAAGDDVLRAGAGNDKLQGGSGNDKLLGGDGNDTYIFKDTWDKDSISDSDGQGALEINGVAISGKFEGIGSRGAYALKVGNTFVGLAVYDDPSSKTGKSAVLKFADNEANQITIKDFDLDKAKAGGYLGIQIDAQQSIAIAASGSTSSTSSLSGQQSNNLWADLDFTPENLAGKESSLYEGGGQSFTISLSQEPELGAKIVLNIAGAIGQGLKAILGDRTVDANGAVIELAPGQTQVSFSLVSDGEIDTDLLGSISASYQGAPDAQGQSSSVSSNQWGVTLTDAGEAGNTYYGDDDPDNFNDVLGGSTGNDSIYGLTGNDALTGAAGNDSIYGGIGQDLIGGGSGNDNIQGGAGNDFISSSATVSTDRQFLNIPSGATLLCQGRNWSVYKQGEVTIWAGINSTRTAGQESDHIDAGVGDNDVMASWGNDRVRGVSSSKYQKCFKNRVSRKHVKLSIKPDSRPIDNCANRYTNDSSPRKRRSMRWQSSFGSKI
jgi:Ca2+-binding RTX toxin-like protein/pimeloyl-ACP methyl ester carboxylesterase